MFRSLLGNCSLMVSIIVEHISSWPEIIPNKIKTLFENYIVLLKDKCSECSGFFRCGL